MNKIADAPSADVRRIACMEVLGVAIQRYIRRRTFDEVAQRVPMLENDK